MTELATLVADQHKVEEDPEQDELRKKPKLFHSSSSLCISAQPSCPIPVGVVSSNPILLQPRRVIAICAGRRPLVYRNSQDEELYSSFGSVKDLPTGYIVALALMGMPFQYDALASESKWAYGKWCHPILDTVRMPGLFQHTGNLGLVPVSAEARAYIARDPELQAKLASLGALDATIMGLTVRQPAAEAIASGEKDIENRPRLLFKKGDSYIDN